MIIIFNWKNIYDFTVVAHFPNEGEHSFSFSSQYFFITSAIFYISHIVRVFRFSQLFQYIVGRPGFNHSFKPVFSQKSLFQHSDSYDASSVIHSIHVLSPLLYGYYEKRSFEISTSNSSLIKSSFTSKV